MPGDWIHLDGKTLRQTRRRTQRLKALPVVSAWAGQTGITMGQVAVAAKSNEITARPQLLALLDLRDKIVTTEAMGCQKAIAETIVAGEGDYILAVKDNQPTWHAELRTAFAQEAAPPPTSTRLYHGREGARAPGTPDGPGIAGAGPPVCRSGGCVAGGAHAGHGHPGGVV